LLFSERVAEGRKGKQINTTNNESQNINKEKKPRMHSSAPERSSLCDQQKEPEIQTTSEKLILIGHGIMNNNNTTR
jgi:hypothetical protein